jgi:hypothetical protein
MGGLWRRYRGWPKWVQIVVPVVLLVIVIAIASGGSKKKALTPARQRQAATATAKKAAADKAAQVAKEKTAAQAAAQKAAARVAATRITLRIPGTFNRTCVLCTSGLAPLVKTSDTFCGWQNGRVVVHVTMRNTAVGHVTVQWDPTYTVENGGVHGDGLTSIQSSGFNAGETRSLLIGQSPKGITANSPLAACTPGFWNISSG